MSGTKAVLEGECMYSSDEKHMNKKGWYQAKETVQGGVADDEGRILKEKRRAVCCPEHYAGLTPEEKDNWEPIPDP